MNKSILLMLLLPMLFLGCKKEEGTSAPSLEVSEDKLALAYEAGQATITLRWAYSEWELTTAEDGFLSDFTFKNGGSQEHASSTRVQFNYPENTTGEEREQELLFTNRTTGVVQTVLISQATKPALLIHIDKALQYQYVQGFGGMYNPGLWTGSNVITQSEIMKMYAPDQLGYNILRLMVYPDESRWAADVEGAKAAQQQGAIIFASPWNVPSDMEEEIDVNGKEHAHLKIERYADYADHLVRYIDYMQSNGVDLYAISVQNEPDMDFTYWRPEEVVDFVIRYGEQIRSTGVKLMSPEACGMSPTWTDPILNNAAALANTDILVGHLYQGILNKETSTYDRDKYNYLLTLSNRLGGKEWWMTEHLFNDGENETDPSKWEFQKWSYNLSHLAQEIHLCMVTDCSAYVYWYLKRFYGILGDTDPRSPVSEGEVTQNGYILSHYAKYAANRTRIHVDALEAYPQLYITAYEGDEDITLVVLNLSNESVPEFQIDVKQPITAVSAEQSTDSKYMVNKEISQVNESTIAVGFEPTSIVSIKLAK